MDAPADTLDANAPGETPKALKHLATVVVVFALLSLIGYASPELVRIRPWVSGEGVPIVRMYERKEALPTFAEAGHGNSQGTSEEDPLATALMANLDEEDAPTPAPAQEATDEDAGVLLAGPTVRVDPKEYDGVTQAIEFPQQLSHFFKKLKQVALKRDKSIARIAHYGDSSVAADAITRTARRRFQKRFGDSGHGFILISRGGMHYGHVDIRHRSSDGWEVISAVRDGLRSGYYGYGGVQARGAGGEYAVFETVDDGDIGQKASRFELYYQKYKRGGRVRMQVDGGDAGETEIDTRADESSDGYATLTAPDGPHKLQLRVVGGRKVHLYGVALERDVPGVVYDSLGLVGARAQRLLNIKQPHLSEQIAHRNPDLLVLGFGGNEAGNKWLDLGRYEEELVQVVDAMRGDRPQMDCLLFGPLDQAERDPRGRVVTIEKLAGIVEVQRRVAKEKGCAFFDTFAAMGGEGSMGRWYRSRPQLAGSDLRHATPEGYRVIGNLYYKALLKAFAESLN